jgi:hypothetical protein
MIRLYSSIYRRRAIYATNTTNQHNKHKQRTNKLKNVLIRYYFTHIMIRKVRNTITNLSAIVEIVPSSKL